MARGRMISRCISTSEKLIHLCDNLEKHKRGLGEFGQLLYTWLICHTDDLGHMDAQVQLVKIKVMPASKRKFKDFSITLKEMKNVELIVLYGENKFLEIVDFENHQTFRTDRDRKTEYPERDENDFGIPAGDNGMTEVDNCRSKLSQDKLSKVKYKLSEGKAVVKRQPKKQYKEYVSMTEEEYNKLLKEYGQLKVDSMLEKLDNYKGSSGKKYKSDYRAILSWVVKEVEGKGGSTKEERTARTAFNWVIKKEKEYVEE